MTSDVYINHIATRTPAHQVHDKFVELIPQWLDSDRKRKLFKRLVQRSQIDERFSVLEPSSEPDRLDKEKFYTLGSFPDTEARMRKFEEQAFPLAQTCLDDLGEVTPLGDITHLIVTSCTGFYAPGLDLDIVFKAGLKPSVERTFIGFMGCFAAINGLKNAFHIVRSQPGARVLMVNLELCTLHLQQSAEWHDVMAFSLFADGCAASLISDEQSGLKINGFGSHVLHEDENLITWRIGNDGFKMHLDFEVPRALEAGLNRLGEELIPAATRPECSLIAVHPGGRAVLDAVQSGFEFDDERMKASREVLRLNGNMSSSSVMFVLKNHLESNATGKGIAMSFGPGLSVESLTFEKRG